MKLVDGSPAKYILKSHWVLQKYSDFCIICLIIHCSVNARIKTDLFIHSSVDLCSNNALFSTSAKNGAHNVLFAVNGSSNLFSDFTFGAFQVFALLTTIVHQR